MRNSLFKNMVFFLLEGTEDKEQTSGRKVSSSDVASEKVRKYSSVDEVWLHYDTLKALSELQSRNILVIGTIFK